MISLPILSLLPPGTLGPGILLIATGFISCHHPYAAVALLTLAVGFSGFQYPGCMVNHVDIASPFAGILFGISNTFATIPGFVAPYVVGVITVDVSSGYHGYCSCEFGLQQYVLAQMSVWVT